MAAVGAKDICRYTPIAIWLYECFVWGGGGDPGTSRDGGVLLMTKKCHPLYKPM